MKKYTLLFTAVLFLLLNSAIAQEKFLTVEDATWMNRALFPKSMSNLQWMGNSD